jgi:hypothetical protein
MVWRNAARKQSPEMKVIDSLRPNLLSDTSECSRTFWFKHNEANRPYRAARLSIDSTGAGVKD